MHGKVDINVEFRPEDNPYFIVHEDSGFESRAGNSQNLQTIRNFISCRTDPNLSPSDRLHAVWICVPASDAIAGKLGEGVEEILRTGTVPVILVFTKFDLVVSQVLFDIAHGDAEGARAIAHAKYEDSCRRLLRKDPRDVPVEIVSDKPTYVNLVENLAATTDRAIAGPHGAGFGAQGERSRVSAIPIAWWAALRVNRGLVLQASIEVGQSRHWRDLSSRVDFAYHPLKTSVNIIHVDLVEIWNLNDETRYLSSDEFKASMSHLIRDLVRSDSRLHPTGAGVRFADWVYDVYDPPGRPTLLRPAPTLCPSSVTPSLLWGSVPALTVS